MLDGIHVSSRAAGIGAIDDDGHIAAAADRVRGQDSKWRYATKA